MKHLLLILSFILSLPLLAQFGPPTNLGINTASGEVHVLAADLDDDGDMDVLSASTSDNKIAWYENLGNDQYAVQKVISIEAAGAMCVHAADIDSDGDIDVLSASAQDDKIAWYENDGSGNFGPQIIISSQINGAYVVSTGDLDGDNDLDIIAAFNFASEIHWFENLGNGVFATTSHLISDLDGSPYSLSLSDIDGDTDLDVVTAYNTDTDLIWYPNDGTGIFGSGNVISSNLLFAPVVSVSTGDLDGDGDNEVISTDYQSMIIHENLGSGVFGTAQSFNIPSFRGMKTHLTDTDNDGDLDILAFFQNHVSNPTQLLLYENTGNLTFLNPVILLQSSNTGYDLFTTDLNQDGLMDIISGYGSRVKRFLNLGQNNFGSPRILNTSAFPDEATVIDMDLDGDMDILENDPLSWYPNEGGGTFGPLRYIVENGGGTSFATSDFNGDNYPDIVWTSDYKLFYYTSLGNGEYGPSQLIDSIGFLPEIQTGDLDGDGDDDILCSIDGFSQVKWFENQGNGSSWQLQAVGNVLNAPSCLIVDLDNNGLNDILVYTGNTLILWHKNLGSGNFSAATALDNSIAVGFMHISDLNNDGLIDLIYSYDQNKLGWKKNLGNGSFGSGSIISSMQYPTRVITEDVDSDGDQDVLVSASWGSSIAWYENDGLANFGLMNTIYNNFYGVNFINTGDINGDTRPDLVSISGVLWFENLGLPNGEPVCSDSIQFQIAEDTVCLGQAISGIIAPVADSGYYTWNLGNIQYVYGTSFSWISNTVGTFDLGIYHVEGTCTRDTVIKVHVESCLMLEEYGKDVFSIYPNPTHMDLTVSTASDFKGELLVELENLLGQRILQKSFLNQHTFVIPFSDQSPGIYLLSITNKVTGVKQTHPIIRE